MVKHIMIERKVTGRKVAQRKGPQLKAAQRKMTKRNMLSNAHNAMSLINCVSDGSFLVIFAALKIISNFFKIVLDKLSNIWYIRIISASFLP
ncbi:MAG: hypothetical protein HQK89_01140 [Nitrospirae bacterium]|nr:hypothetical protein [Nitrospirota bacterium]